MTAADVPAVVAIEAVCFPSSSPVRGSLPTPEQRFLEEFSRPWSYAWVVRDGAKAMAFLLVWVVADEVHLLNLATHPAKRRRGIGASLVATAMAFAHSRRARLILLEVRRSNEGAMRLYRAAGFFVSGIRSRYYSNDEDAVEMELLLDPRTGEVLPRDDEVGIDA
jgi:[ribosomal protein S18]-alanine N-acetyltransferase